MTEAVKMDVDSLVYVLKMPGLPERVPAKIRYKGPLKNKSGLWFGVELSTVSLLFYHCLALPAFSPHSLFLLLPCTLSSAGFCVVVCLICLSFSL